MKVWEWTKWHLLGIERRHQQRAIGKDRRKLRRSYSQMANDINRAEMASQKADETLRNVITMLEEQQRKEGDDQPG